MKKMKLFTQNKYLLATVIISLIVAILVHFPESISLFHNSETECIFPGMQLIDVASEITFTFLSLLLLFALNTLLFPFSKATARISTKTLLLSFLFSWIISSLLGKGFFYLHQAFGLPAVDATVHHYLHPLRDIIMGGLVTLSCYIIHLIARQQLVNAENLQLQSENIRNQYEALKNQLNPHMLFNSLNTLRSLVREDQHKAQDYIQELSKVLRYTLQSNESQLVTLHDEMKFVSASIFLLKMRFEDNLIFDIRTDSRYQHYYLPPMAIQMLIENAVRHNEISSRNPLTIVITTHDNGYISVSNKLQPKITSNPGMGVGLANLQKRYQLLLQKEIIIKKNEYFTVMVPLNEKRL